MSTPISRDNKLQGLELYAPRRARVRAVPKMKYRCRRRNYRTLNKSKPRKRMIGLAMTAMTWRTIRR